MVLLPWRHNLLFGARKAAVAAARLWRRDTAAQQPVAGVTIMLRDCLRCSSAAVGRGERSHDCCYEEANAAYWWLLATVAEAWLVVLGLLLNREGEGCEREEKEVRRVN